MGYVRREQKRNYNFDTIDASLFVGCVPSSIFIIHDASNVFEQRYKTENNVINQLYPPSVYVSYPLFFWGINLFSHS